MADNPQSGMQGQEVRQGSSGSFQFNPLPVNQAVASVFTPPVRGPSASGGRVTSQGAVRAEIDTREVTMPPFLEQALSKNLQKKQQAAFWKGLTEARQGRSIQEIETQAPWYSKVFGPSDFLQGAQYYTAQSALSKWEVQTMQDMQELKKVPEHQVGPLLNKVAEDFMTGSPDTDAMIQASMIQRAGPIIDQHKKERYAWQQSEATKAQLEAFTLGSDAYELHAKNYATLSDNDKMNPDVNLGLLESQRNAMMGLVLPPGMSPEAELKFVENGIVAIAQRGNFHTIKQVKESGIISQLPVERQKVVEDAIERYEQRHIRKTAALEFAPDLQAFYATATTGQVSALEVTAEAARLNRKFAAATGIDSPLLDVGDITRAGTSAASALIRARERFADKQFTIQQSNANAAAKEMAEARNTTQITQMVVSGQAGLAVALPGVSKDKVDSIAMQAMLQMPLESRNTLMASNFNATGYVNPHMQKQLQAGIDSTVGEAYTEAFDQSYETWKAMAYSPAGMGAAAGYYQQDHIKMQAYNSLVNAGIPKEFAYKKSFGDEFLYGSDQIPADVRKDAKKEIDSVVDSADGWWWGSTKLADSAKGIISNATANNFVRIRNNSPELSAAAAGKQAFDIAKANGLEVHGQWAWQNPTGTQPLATLSGIDQSDFAEIFNDVVTEKAIKAGAPTTLRDKIGTDVTYSMLRYADTDDGKAMVRIMLYDDEGNATDVMLTSDDLREERNTRANKQRNKAAMKQTRDPNRKPILTFQDVADERRRKEALGANPATSGLW